MQQFSFYSFQKHKIHYTSFGKGKEVLIAFHGFADRSEVFLKLEKSISSTYRVIAIDVPFHGKTKWNTESYNEQDLIELVQFILEKENIQEFSMMGHSMGARLVLVLAAAFQKQINQLYLLAPDGLRSKWLFNMNLVPVFIRRWLSRRTAHPTRLIQLTEKLYQWKLIPTIAHQFVTIHLANPRRRKRLLYTWLSLANFMTFPPRLKKELVKASYTTYLIFGKHDQIIKAKIGRRYEKLAPAVQVHYIETGHRMFGDILDEKLQEIVS